MSTRDSRLTLVLVVVADLVGLAASGFLVVAFDPPVARVVAGAVAGLSAGLLVATALRARRDRRLLAGPLEPGAEPPDRAYLTPTQLPPPPDLFVGRQRETQLILDAWRDHRDDRCFLAGIHGAAGIGKTALALDVAYRLAGQFPDGQLFCRLGAGAAEADVLRGFVVALGGPGDRVPAGAAELLDRYRALTAGRRVLIVLDDATGDPDPARLLPASGTAAVLVTSREPLPALPAGPSLPLAPLAAQASLKLLSSLVGEDRVAGAETAAHQLVECSDHYPLAVRLAGDSLARRPHWSLRESLDRTRLVTGAAGPDPFDGRLDVTYALLTEEERHALLLLGLLPSTTFVPWMLAALLGTTDESLAVRLADRLVFARLVNRSTNDVAGLPTFEVLDHVHGYARSRAATDLTEDERAGCRQALRRARTRRTGTSAESALRGNLYRIKDQGQLGRAMNEARAALALARENGDRPAEGLALATMAEFSAELGGTEDAAELAVAALAFDSPRGRARAYRCRAIVFRRHQRFEAAIRELSQALVELRAVERAGVVETERIRILRERALTLAMGGYQGSGFRDHTEASDLSRRRPNGGELMQAGLAWVAGTMLALDGQVGAARAELARGVATAERLGQELWLAWLGHARARIAFDAGGQADCQQLAAAALDGFGRMEHRYGTASARLLLGESYLRSGDLTAASTHLEEALALLHSCGDRHAETRALTLLARVRKDQARPADERRLLDAAARVDR